MFDYLQNDKTLLPSQVSFAFNPPQSPGSKNQKKGPFCRKKIQTESSLSKKTLTLGNQSSREIAPLQRRTSIDKLRLQNSPNALMNQKKPMFPNTPNTVQLPNHVQKIPEQIKEKFIRYVAAQHLKRNSLQKEARLSLKLQNSKLTMHTQNSVDSSDWLRIQKENEFLRRQKKYLQNQVYQLKQIIKEAKIELPIELQIIELQCTQCRNRSVNLFPINSKNSAPKLQYPHKERSNEFRLSLQGQNIKLRQQLQNINNRLEAQNKNKIELCQMVQMFKSRYEQSVKTLENYNIKLNVLLRQKAEYEGAMIMTDKMNKQRQNLRKTLLEYRQKISILSKAIVKSKQLKEEEKDVSLDLSTSIDIYQ